MKRTPAPKVSPHPQFVTTRTAGRVPLFRHGGLCREFLAALLEVRQKHRFELFAYVIMPDHVHLLVRPSDGRISDLMRKIKSLSARGIVESLKVAGNNTLLASLRKPSVGRRRDSYQAWQDGFHAVPLWGEWMIRKKIDYIHANPLRRSLAKSAKDYAWSSFSAYHGIGKAKLPLDFVRL